MYLNRNQSPKYVFPLSALVSCALLAACEVGGASSNSSATAACDCVIIDNDYDIDDMMAIPLVIGNKYVAAIIQSEGYTMPQQSAAAIEQLINKLPDQPNQRKIPIIVGGQQGANGRTDLTDSSWLPFFRSRMNLSNGLLSSLPAPAQANPDYARQVANSVAKCSSVTVLIIGTYTSFINYSPLIRDKIDKVVIMGQGLCDQSASPDMESFNCHYDLDACTAAMHQLDELNTFFVDIPRIPGCDKVNPSSECYNPTYEMVAGSGGSGGIGGGGLPSRLKQALLNSSVGSWPSGSGLPKVPGAACTSQSTWVPADVFKGPGGEMLLWDQSAALFLLHPEIFSLYYPPGNLPIGGKHYRPSLVDGSNALAVQRLRQLWTDDTNRSIIFYP